MPDRWTTKFLIRPLRRTDRQAVRDICVETAWLGGPGRGHIPDPWIWAEFWTRYFTDRAPRHSWVVCDADDGHVAGYLMGTDDVRRFDRYAPFLLPGIILRTIRKRLISRSDTRAATLAMLKSMIRGEMDIPPALVGNHPATMHIDLLPEARGRGYGAALYELFLQRMMQLGVPGIHAQTLSVNEPITRFCRHAGFTLAASKPIDAFKHVESEPIEILTWTKSPAW